MTRPTTLAALLHAGRAHAPALAAVHAASFPPGERWGEATFVEQLALPGIAALVDPEGGFVLVRNVADEAEILTLAVAPALRRQGRGRALLAAVVRHAAALGASALFLEVAEGNGAARALYAQAGFSEIGRRRAYYSSGEAAIVLRLELMPSATPGVSLP